MTLKYDFSKLVKQMDLNKTLGSFFFHYFCTNNSCTNSFNKLYAF